MDDSFVLGLSATVDRMIDRVKDLEVLTEELVSVVHRLVVQQTARDDYEREKMERS